MKSSLKLALFSFLFLLGIAACNDEKTGGAGPSGAYKGDDGQLYGPNGQPIAYPTGKLLTPTSEESEGHVEEEIPLITDILGLFTTTEGRSIYRAENGGCGGQAGDLDDSIIEVEPQDFLRFVQYQIGDLRQNLVFYKKVGSAGAVAARKATVTIEPGADVNEVRGRVKLVVEEIIDGESTERTLDYPFILSGQWVSDWNTDAVFTAESGRWIGRAQDTPPGLAVDSILELSDEDHECK